MDDARGWTSAFGERFSVIDSCNADARIARPIRNVEAGLGLEDEVTIAGSSGWIVVKVVPSAHGEVVAQRTSRAERQRRIHMLILYRIGKEECVPHDSTGGSCGGSIVQCAGRP